MSQNAYLYIYVSTEVIHADTVQIAVAIAASPARRPLTMNTKGRAPTANSDYFGCDYSSHDVDASQLRALAEEGARLAFPRLD